MAAAKDVVDGEDGSWVGLGIAAVAIIPGLDFLKGGSRAGRNLLREVAEQGLSEVSQEGLKQLTKTLGKETTEHASKELVTLAVAREEMLARLSVLSNEVSLPQNTRVAIEKAQVSLQHHLKQEDLVGALRDVHGTPVVINGRTFNHLQEVEDALRSLNNAKANLTTELRHYLPGTTEYQRVSQEVEALAETVKRTEGYLNIGKN